MNGVVISRSSGMWEPGMHGARGSHAEGFVFSRAVATGAGRVGDGSARKRRPWYGRCDGSWHA